MRDSAEVGIELSIEEHPSLEAALESLREYLFQHRSDPLPKNRIHTSGKLSKYIASIDHYRDSNVYDCKLGGLIGVDLNIHKINSKISAVYNKQRKFNK